jgi:hypothetical protein
MAATKSRLPARRRPNEAIAGPGQKPAKPQPTPNSVAPASKRMSIRVLAGISNRSANAGRAMRRDNR